MPINTFGRDVKFDFFARGNRDKDLCPHCGKRGNLVDEGTVYWNDSPQSEDFDYECASCGREWVIRRYRKSGFSKYPHPDYAVIYTPERSS